MESEEAVQDDSEASSPGIREQPLTIANNHSHKHNRNHNYIEEVEETAPVDDYDALTNRHSDRSPPLLMAPPRSRLEELQHKAEVAALYVFSLVGIERDLINHALRIGLFVLKLTTLAQPCWPYTIKLEVAIPLILIGALDLRVPEASQSALARRNRQGEVEFGPSRMRGLTWSLFLVAFHVAMLWAARSLNSLCVTHALHEWEQW